MIRSPDFNRGLGVSIIIPTIAGRIDSLKRTVDAYIETTNFPYGGYEIIVVRDYPNWPVACNAGAKQAEGGILHFGADDLVPYGDWLMPCLPVLAKGELPAPSIWNYEHTGEPWNGDGPPGSLTRFTRVPILTRAQYDAIGEWPDIIYYADCWVSDKARFLGMETRVVGGYDFVHFWAQEGRLDGDKKDMDAAFREYQNLVSEFGL